jgi:hypothetical protein
MDLVRAFVSSAALTGDVAGKLKGLLELQKELGNTEQKIETQREQMTEYRSRMDELHLQIVTLKAVKTGGSLMKNLEKKLEEVSDKLSKSTVDLVALEERRRSGRIKLQDGVTPTALEASKSKMAEAAVRQTAGSLASCAHSLAEQPHQAREPTWPRGEPRMMWNKTWHDQRATQSSRGYLRRRRLGRELGKAGTFMPSCFHHLFRSVARSGHSWPTHRCRRAHRCVTR